MIGLEVCANSIASALAAQQGGAFRVELCNNLNEGGITPSYGQIIVARKLLHISFFVLIRPRSGDFLYSDQEFEMMKEDIRLCKQTGCDGIVAGVLNTDGTIDTERTIELVQLAHPMQVTFHRAFDQSADLLQSLEAVITTGCQRILTSGGSQTAIGGIENIRALVKAANNRIGIMPGSGIDEQNIQQLAQIEGITELHTSAKVPVQSMMEFQSTAVSFSANDYTMEQTSELRVKELIRLANS